MKSVVLLSGGLDSAANLAFCKHKAKPVLTLTFNYGQKAAMKEIEAAAALSKFYDVRHEIVSLPFVQNLGGSSLIDLNENLPELRSNELDTLSIIEKSAKSVWVPNRNGVLLNIAAAYAERMEASRVVVGFNLEEAVTFPDNSEAFLNATTHAFSFSTANHVEAFCYTTQWNKREIVKEVMKLDSKFPKNLLWSCYNSGEKICGKCESCQRFLRAWERLQ